MNKKIFIKDKKKNKLFSVRDIGEIPKIRANNFYIHEPDTVKWIKSFKKKSYFLDIGSNIGIYSLYAAKRKVKVISLEPQSLNYSLLCLNIADNKFENLVTAFPLSADINNRPSYLYHSKKLKFGGAHSSFDRNISDQGGKFKVIYKSGSYAVNLDNFLSILKFKPNYIKIDVDGNELQVIKGLKKTLNSVYLKSVLIEINPEFIEHQKCVYILKKSFDSHEIVNVQPYSKIYNIIFKKK